MRLSERASGVAAEVRDVVRAHVKEHGYKRGLHLFARAVGVSERRARSFHEGTAGRIDAAEYLAALEARGALNRVRAARLRAELEALERGAMHGAGGVQGGRAAGAGDVLGERPDGGCGGCPRPLRPGIA